MLRYLLFFAALVFAAPQHAVAAETSRFALLIGNKTYVEAVGPLKNPHNDVDLVETSLKKIGFTVTVIKDADYRAMDTALKRYVRAVSRSGPGAISFFYYSGHGIANPETKINYLIPIDVKEPNDEKIWDEAFQQNDIIEKLNRQTPQATHYIVFDACRNELHVTGPAAKALGADKGFVAVNSTPGILIAYATAPSKTASDVGEGGGPYAKALSDEILKPGVEAVSMFRSVQIRVKQAINQDPWLSFPSLPEVYFAGKEIKVEPPPAPVPSPSAEAEKAWTQVEITTSVPALEMFIRRFGHLDSFYTDLAKTRMTELKQRAELEVQAANEARKRAEEEARAKAEIESQRLALQHQQERERQQEETRNRAKAEAEQAWSQVKDSVSIPALDTFVRRYGDSFYGELAKARITDLRQQAEEKQRADEEARRKAENEAKLAMLPPATQEAILSVPDMDKLTRDLQTELKRVGCDPNEVSGNWGSKSKAALADFARHTYLSLMIDEPTSAALRAVMDQKSRICPLQCEKGKIELNGECMVAPSGRRTTDETPKKAPASKRETASNKPPKAPKKFSKPCYSTGVLIPNEKRADFAGLCND